MNYLLLVMCDLNLLLNYELLSVASELLLNCEFVAVNFIDVNCCQFVAVNMQKPVILLFSKNLAGTRRVAGMVERSEERRVGKECLL